MSEGHDDRIVRACLAAWNGVAENHPVVSNGMASGTITRAAWLRVAEAVRRVDAARGARPEAGK